MNIITILKKVKWAISIVIFLIFIAVFAEFIANDGKDVMIPPLVPYAATTQDRQNDDFKSPFSQQNITSAYYRHWLGTDQLGRDILSGIISGTRTALFVGIGGTAIALCIGLFLGLCAGYFQNDRFQLTLLGLILRGGLFSAFLFYSLIFIQQQMPIYAFLLLILGVIGLIYLFDFLLLKFFKGKTISFPVDNIIMRLIEVFQAVPAILWLFGLVGINGNKRMTILSLVIFMGLVSWTTIARLVRGEVIRIRQTEYMETAQVLGLSHSRILVHHTLPNILTPILTAALLGISNLILMEAFLTFIGFGLPVELVTWGSMLNVAKENPSAWWMVIVPGFMIFITTFSLNRIGEALRE